MSLPYNTYGSNGPSSYYPYNQQQVLSNTATPLGIQTQENQTGANVNQAPLIVASHNHNLALGAIPTLQNVGGTNGGDNDNRRLNPLPGMPPHHQIIEGEHFMNHQGLGMKLQLQQHPHHQQLLYTNLPTIPLIQSMSHKQANSSGVDMSNGIQNNPSSYGVFPNNSAYLGQGPTGHVPPGQSMTSIPLHQQNPQFVGPFLNKSYDNDAAKYFDAHSHVLNASHQYHPTSQYQPPPPPLPLHQSGQPSLNLQSAHMPPKPQMLSRQTQSTPPVHSQDHSPLPGPFHSQVNPSYSSHSPYTTHGGYSSPISLDATTSRAIRSRSDFLETYKPTRPKKNSKPRIRKLNKAEAIKRDISKQKQTDDICSEAATDPFFIQFQISLKISKNVMELNVPPYLLVKTELEKKLFDLFIHQVSRCMDMFMIHDFFADVVPKMALLDDTGMILSSMYSLSALMLQRIDPASIELSVPINYYHQTIRSIRHYLSLPSTSEDNDGIIARCLLSTILLGVYEMFFLATDNTYVKGAVSLLTSIISKNQDNSLLKNSPFLQMCFWTMFVCDLILSLKFNLPAMFSVRQFWMQIDPEFIEQFNKPYNKVRGSAAYNADSTVETNNYIDFSLFISRQEAVWWLHKALLDFSIIHEFNTEVVILNNEEFNSNKLFHDWLILNQRVDEFEKNIPTALKPIIYKPSSADSTYPTIYFRDELSALVTLQFKLSQISLYQALIQKTNLQSPEVQDYLGNIPRNHAKLLAKDVIGILKTYDLNIYLWRVNIHTIRQVARYLHDDEDEYKELEQLMERVIETCHFIFQSKVIIG